MEKPRSRPRLRRWLRLAAAGLAALGILGGLLYLFRWPLLAGRVTRMAERELGRALSADVRVGGISGSLITNTELRGIEIRPGPASPLGAPSRIDRLRIDYSPLLLLASSPAAVSQVEVSGAVLKLRSRQKADGGDAGAALRSFLEAPPDLRRWPAVRLLDCSISSDSLEAAGLNASLVPQASPDGGRLRAQVAAAGLAAHGRRLGSLSGQALLRWPGRHSGAVIEAEIETTGGALDGSLRLELPLANAGPAASCEIDLQGRTADLPALIPVPRQLDALAGGICRSAEIHFAVRGPLAKLNGGGWLRLVPGPAADSAAAAGLVPVACREGVVTLGPAALPTLPGLLRLGGSLPLRQELEQLLLPSQAGEGADLYATVEMDNLDAVTPHLPAALRAMSPQAKGVVTARLRGALRRPEALLEASVQDGVLRFPAPLSPLTDISMSARLSRGELRVEAASARMEAGSISASGGLSFRDGGAFRFGLKGKDLLLLDGRDGVRLRLDPDLEFSGRPGNGMLRGRVDVPTAGYYREFVGGGGGGRSRLLDRENVMRALAMDVPAARRRGAALPGLAGQGWLGLDIAFASKGEVLVENSVLGALLTGRLKLGGTAGEPELSGEVRTVSGEVRLFPGVILGIERGLLRVPDAPGAEPQVDFQTEVTSQGIRVFANVSGPLSAPVLRLTSTPPYGQEDLVALLAYGRAPGKESAGPASEAALAQAGRLVGNLAMDRAPEPRPRRGLLSRLAVGYGSESGTRSEGMLRQQAVRGNALYAAYAINDFLAIVSSRDSRGGVNGDLQLRLRWPRPDAASSGSAGDGRESPGAAGPAASTPSMTRFSGNRAHRDSRLRELIAPDLQRLGPEGWTEVAASDAAYRILRFLLDEGHFFAEVHSQLRDSSVRFRIVEGPRVRPGDIRFAGNHQLAGDLLRKRLYRDWPRLGRVPFTAKLLAAQVQSVESCCAEEGCLLARVAEPAIQYDERRRRMNVTYRIREGPIFLLEGVDWEGVEKADAQALKALARPYVGGVLRASVPGTLTSAVRAHYRDRGHALARVSSSRTLDAATGKARLTVSVVPGPQLRLGDVTVTGTRASTPEFVRRVAGLRPGETITPAGIRRAERRLSETGAFRSFFTEIRPRREAAGGAAGSPLADLDISLTEVEPYEATLRLGYGSFDGVRAGAELGFHNLLGRAEALTVGGNWSQRGYQTYADASVPPWPGLPLTANARGFFEEQEDVSFSVRNYGVSPYLSLDISPSCRLSTGLIFEWVKTTGTPPSTSTDTLDDFRMGSGFVALTLDHRDAPVLARSGFLATARVALADQDVYGDISFTQASAAVSAYLPVFDWLTLATSVQGRMIKPFGETREIPIALRCFGGGAGSVRGFEEGTLGPEFDGDPVGGEVLLAAQTELRVRVWAGLHAAAFYDVGNVYARTEDVDLGELRYGVGPGLRYYTPVGAIGLDVGFNPERKSGEDSPILHVALGLSF